MGSNPIGLTNYFNDLEDRRRFKNPIETVIETVKFEARCEISPDHGRFYGPIVSKFERLGAEQE